MPYLFTTKQLLQRASLGLALLPATALSSLGQAPSVNTPPVATAPRASASISGTALDGRSGEPLAFATVVLRRALPADSSVVASVLTAGEGHFQLEHVPVGAYRLEVMALGYATLRQQVSLGGGQSTLALGSLRVQPASKELEEVVVTGQKETVVEELGKRVINVEKDLGSVGGTAVNVLQNVPSVAVDASGTVSLRGSSNLTILIDGKPAGTTNGGGSGPRLDQLPASRIAQVEVITNPSAKYDASGAGVINIITKKQTGKGLNGQVGVVLGNGAKYAPTLSLSRRLGKASWNLNYNGSDQQYRSTSASSQTAQLTAGPVRTTQTGESLEHHRNHSLGLSVDYELKPQQTLSLSVTPSWESSSNHDDQVLTQEVNGTAAPRQRGQQREESDVRILNANTEFRRSWAAQPGRELSANIGGVGIDATVPISQAITEGNSLGWRQDLAAQLGIFYGGIDYVHPLAGGKGRVETGVKVQHTGTAGTADMLVATSAERPNELQRDPARSVAYNFRETLPAAYVTYQRKLEHGYNVQGGLRAEYTRLNGEVENGQGRVDVDYLGLFPSATVSRELGKEPGQQRVQLSYARRLNRPNFMQQLPFAIYHDPRYYRLGNPELRAEFSHNLELGHQVTLPGGASFSSTVFARITTDAIQRLRNVDEAATQLNPAVGVVTAETFRNFGTTTNLGLELSWNQPLAKWWRVAATGSIYRSEIAANSDNLGTREALAGTARLNNNFSPTPKLDVQLTGSFRSATPTAQGRQLATGGLDLALRQRLWNDRAALTLRVSDLLNTQIRRFELDAPGLTASLSNKYETRVAWLGFTWYVGASKPGKRIDSAPQGGGGGFGG